MRPVPLKTVDGTVVNIRPQHVMSTFIAGKNKEEKPVTNVVMINGLVYEIAEPIQDVEDALSRDMDPILYLADCIGDLHRTIMNRF